MIPHSPTQLLPWPSAPEPCSSYPPRRLLRPSACSGPSSPALLPPPPPPRHRHRSAGSLWALSRRRARRHPARQRSASRSGTARRRTARWPWARRRPRSPASSPSRSVSEIHGRPGAPGWEPAAPTRELRGTGSPGGRRRRCCAVATG
ncbi:hypothetical protein GQ55_7G217200 [Panicum hallii var. hallii]|uniref:Uncharacterized protein n=1 Tax=Panicum hallii var. hallii TaxID=1504633 RepID=A0A2T7CXL6_9POAL|nr:hypothetical protein GQ55_7G217200 [Panicum hallii var. hallii]